MSNYHKINHIYKTLLNRNIKEEEYRNNLNKDFKSINLGIVNSEEYKKFLDSLKKAIHKEFSNRLNLDTNKIILSPILEHTFLNHYRISHYNSYKINLNYLNLINEVKKSVRELLDYFLGENIINKEIEEECYYLLLKNNFNYNEMEFMIINSPYIDKLLGK
tara:strand:- start:2202 stop:2687 length:486 start_codon:yes stop_codon:yes gene_type:complete